MIIMTKIANINESKSINNLFIANIIDKKTIKAIISAFIFHFLFVFWKYIL